MVRPTRKLSFIVYISTIYCAEEEIEKILCVSRANNARDDVTGMLMHDRRHFLQFLEGPEASVGATVLRIAADPRHRDMRLLASEKVEFRLFSKWDMRKFAIPDGRATLASQLSCAETLQPAERAEALRSFAIRIIS